MRITVLVAVPVLVAGLVAACSTGGNTPVGADPDQQPDIRADDHRPVGQQTAGRVERAGGGSRDVRRHLPGSRQLIRQIRATITPRRARARPRLSAMTSR